AIDADGNLFFSDSGNKRIRVIRYGAVMAEPGSTVTATAGTPQTITAGRAFAGTLQITLMSPAGTPENGIRVDFAAPSSGASCSFAGGASTVSVLTDINGQASAVCTANLLAGSYSVTATPLTLGSSATFSLVNAAAPPTTFNVS